MISLFSKSLKLRNELPLQNDIYHVTKIFKPLNLYETTGLKMETKTQMTLKFYQNLGKLFYAIAAADKEVREPEIKKLKEIIKKEWLAIDDIVNGFGTDGAYQIEFIFDWLTRDEEYDSNTCYKDFIAYKNDHNEQFTKKIKQLILKTAFAIAESFSGKNKSELILLAKLNIELNKQ